MPITVVTIDGPSGAGKGTVARLLAARLGWHLLDSGALYRLVALAGERRGLPALDADAHARLAAQMDVQFGMRSDGTEQVLLDQDDVTAAIRTERAGMGASRVAAWPGVRAALLARQRAFADLPGLVADGRDMGTTVFPAAPLKIYLTATPDERARRRHNQLKDKGSAVSLAALSREIAERDRQDSTRAVSPLFPADDAVMLDSTGHSALDMVAAIWQLGVSRHLWRADAG